MKFQNFVDIEEIQQTFAYIQNKCEEKNFKGHTNSVFAMTLNDTGSLLYTGSEDKSIRVWNTKTCKEIKNLRMNLEGITALINNDNFLDFLYSGDQSGVIRQWDSGTGKEIIEKKMEGHQGPINSLTMNKDGTRIYSASRDRTIRVWSTETANEIQELRIKTDHDVMTITFNYVNNVFYTGSAGENFIRIWDIETNQEFEDLNFKGHEDEMINIIYVPEMKKLFSCSEDQTVRVWDPVTRHEIKELRISQIQFDITSMDINKDGSKMYLGSADGKVVLWENQIKSKPEQVLKNDRDIVKISGDAHLSKYAVATFENGDIYVWDTETKTKKFYSNNNIDKILYISEILLNTFFTIFEDGTVRIFVITEDAHSSDEDDEYEEAMQQMPEIVQQFKPVLEFKVEQFRDIDFGFVLKKSQMDYEIFIVQGDGVLKHYRVEQQSAQLIRQMEGHKDQITCAVFNERLNYLYTGSLDETIRIWDLETYQELEDLIIEGHGYQINDMVINQSCTRIYSCSEQEKIIRAWDANTCESLDQLVFKGHTRPLLQIELSGKNRLYSSSYDNTIRVWDTKTGDEIKEYRIDSQQGAFYNLLITRNSNQEEKLIATVGQRIYLWNLESFSEIQNVRLQMNVANLLKKNHPRTNNHLKIASRLIQYIKNSFPFIKINTKIGLFLSQLSQGEIIIDYLEALGYNHYNYDLVEEILNMIQILKAEVARKKKRRETLKKENMQFYDQEGSNILSLKQRSPKNSKIMPIDDKEMDNIHRYNHEVQFFVQSEEDLLENLEYNLEEILLFLQDNYDEEVYLTSRAVRGLIYYEKLQDLVSNVICMYYQKKLSVIRIQKLPSLITPIIKLDSHLDIRSNEYLKIQDKVPSVLESSKIIQYQVYHSKYGLDIQNGSYFSILFFNILSQSDFENQNKFKSLIDYKYSRVYKYMLIWSTFYFVFAILYNIGVYVYPHRRYIFGILREFKTALFSLKVYLSDFYNVLDILLLTFSLITLFLTEDRRYKHILDFITVLLVNFRATLELRVFSEMRYLIAMILQVFRRIIPFLIMMTIFIYIYASMLMSADLINRKQLDDTYWDKMQIALNLGLGDFDSDAQAEWNLFEWFIFLFNAITLTVMMLNLIISIISDIFAQFSQDQKIVDLQQKVELILNIDMLLYVPKNILYYLPSLNKQKNHYFQFLKPKIDQLTLEEKVDELTQLSEDQQKSFQQNLNDVQTCFNQDLNNIKQDMTQLNEKMDIILNFIKKRSKDKQQLIITKNQRTTQPINNRIIQFKQLSLVPQLQQYLVQNNLLTASPIQGMALQHIHKNNNMYKNKEAYYLGAPTGSGKTYAYLLPLFNTLKQQEIDENMQYRISKRPRAIILIPNRELIDQVSNVATNISHIAKLKIEKINDAKQWKKQMKRIEDGCDILITNFAKLQRMIKENKIDLSLVQYVVFDEADVFIETGKTIEMFEMIRSNQSAVNRHKDIKHIFVSATLTKKLEMFLQEVFQNKIQFLTTSDTCHNMANMEHLFVPVGQQNRLELLNTELKMQFDKKSDSYFLVFCNSVACTRAVDFFLNKCGYKVNSLHGEMPGRMRVENYKSFADKQYNILVTSDLAARGLDFTFLDGVVNFDFPHNVNDYIHRAGRASRIGSPGQIISFYYKKNVALMEVLQNSYDQNLPVDLGKSSYSLQKEKQKEKRSVIRNMDNDFVPQEFRDIYNKMESIEKDKKIIKEKGKKKIFEKKAPNYKKKQQKGIKKEIKKVKKYIGEGKRVKFLQKQLKRTEKEHIRKKQGKK